MSIVYLNGEFLPLERACISPMDRGFLFADGVYEVIPVFRGEPFGLAQHLQRLQRSLDAIRMPAPMSLNELTDLLMQVVARNGFGHQTVYLQITRGKALVRDHAFPEVVVPTVFIMSSPVKVPELGFSLPSQGIKAITLPDIRWLRCDIKSISLLPNILSRQEAVEHDAQEAILVRDGFITEAAAANVFIVNNGVVATPELSQHILGGITRDMVIELAGKNGLACNQRPVTESELFAADEIWITSATRDVMPVVMLNNVPLGDGQPGPVWRKMADWFLQRKKSLFGLSP